MGVELVNHIINLYEYFSAGFDLRWAGYWAIDLQKPICIGPGLPPNPTCLGFRTVQEIYRCSLIDSTSYYTRHSL